MVRLYLVSHRECHRQPFFINPFYTSNTLSKLRLLGVTQSALSFSGSIKLNKTSKVLCPVK